MNRDLFPRIVGGFNELWDFADRVVKDGEQNGVDPEGLLGAMIESKRAGKLDETEIRQNLLMLATAGYDTSKNMLGLIMYLMLDKPEQWARCAEDIKFCGNVVEEAIRHSSIASIFRGVGQEFEYDGITFPKDTSLIFLLGLTGRDPSAFPDPLDFKPDRVHTNRHVAFGRGVHICIGQYLAKFQLEEGVHVIAQRLRKPRLVGEIDWKPYLGAWGLSTLPIAFDPAPSSTAH